MSFLEIPEAAQNFRQLSRGELSVSLRLLKQVVNEAAGEKNTGGVPSGVR